LESGDESVAPTPKGSANTGSDAGTDYGEDEDVEVAASPGTQLSCVIYVLFSALVLSLLPLSSTFGKVRERSWKRREG